MLYALYQSTADLMLPMRLWAAVAGQGFVLGGEATAERWRAASALCEMMSRAALSHRRPSFGIDTIKVGNQMVPVQEEEVLATPFGTLLRFAKESRAPQPRVLVRDPAA
jgi:poly(3-hydroxybutyrate) depolymerase